MPQLMNQQNANHPMAKNTVHRSARPPTSSSSDCRSPTNTPSSGDEGAKSTHTSSPGVGLSPEVRATSVMRGPWSNGTETNTVEV